jgi:hypothetical protein
MSRFETPQPQNCTASRRWTFDLCASFSPLLSNNGYRDPNALFAPDPVRIDTPAMKGQL